MSPCHRSNLNLIVKEFLSRLFCARQLTSVNCSVVRVLGNSVLHVFSSFVSATDWVACKNKYCKDLSCKDISSLLLKSVPLAFWKKDWNHLHWCRGSKPKGSRASCITTAGAARCPSRFRVYTDSSYMWNWLSFFLCTVQDLLPIALQGFVTPGIMNETTVTELNWPGEPGC